MICKKCGNKMTVCGFERRLITRGNNKGQSMVKEYFTCYTCKANKDKKS